MTLAPCSLLPVPATGINLYEDLTGQSGFSPFSLPLTEIPEPKRITLDELRRRRQEAPWLCRFGHGRFTDAEADDARCPKCNGRLRHQPVCGVSG